MKSLFPLFIAALSVLPCAARQLSPDESLQRLSALENGPSRARAFAQSTLTLAHTEKQAGHNTLYVFNRTDDGGFIILSADDLAPEVLGFSDSGSFDATAAAPHFLAWLADYSHDISRAIEHSEPVAATSRHAKRNAISPLLTTKWGQGATYDNRSLFNLYCPTIDNTKCPTGCMATAMAQIMYYHKWPQRGTGSKSYTTHTHKVNLSANFANTTYDWSSMQNTYGYYYDESGSRRETSVTTTSNNAVSRLMFNCGIASEMDYTPNSSGTTAVSAMQGIVNHFGYNRQLSLRMRDYYDDDSWEALIYGEIAHGNPVLYCGRTENDEGHAFVCDGYKDGFFHINWGWEGMSDGYYTLLGSNNLHPLMQGTGGSYSSDAFNNSHHVLIGFQRPQDVTEPTHAICADDFTVYDNDTETPYLNKDGYAIVYFEEGAFNFTASTLDFEVGLELHNRETGKSYRLVCPESIDDMEPFKGIRGYYASCTDVPDGVYTTTPIYRVVGESSWTPILLPPDLPPVLIAYGDATLPDTPDTPQPSEADGLCCSDVSSPTATNTNRQLFVHANNPGYVGADVFDGYVTPVLLDEDGHRFYIFDGYEQPFSMEGGKYNSSIHFDFTLKLPDAIADGHYYASMAGRVKNGTQWSNFQTLDLTQKRVVDAMPTFEFWVKGQTVSTTEIKDTPAPADADLFCESVSCANFDVNRTLHVTITNPGNYASVDFDGYVALSIHDSEGHYLRLLDEYRQEFTMEARRYSSSFTIDAPLPDDLPDDQYVIAIAALPRGGKKWTLFREYDFEANKILDRNPYFDIWLRGQCLATTAPPATTPQDAQLFCSTIAPLAHCLPNRQLRFSVKYPGNIGKEDFDGLVAPAIYTTDGQQLFRFTAEAQPFEMQAGYYNSKTTFDFDLTVPDGLPDGHFRIYMEGYQKWSDNWTLFRTFDVDSKKVNSANPFLDFWVKGTDVADYDLDGNEGLKQPTMSPTAAQVYDLSGRRVAPSRTKGISIIQGRKTIR